MAGNMMPAGPAPAPAPGGTMAPQAPPPPENANMEQAVVESLNVAQAATLEAVENAEAAPTIGEETVAKLQQGAAILSEAQQEVQAAAGTGPADAGGAAAAGGLPPSGVPSGAEG